MNVESEENESTLIRAHIPCEKCSSHDACAEYTDHYHCFSCGATWSKGAVSDNKLETSFERKLERMEEGKIREIADRCLTEETCRKFGVRSLVKDHRIQKHFYPYYNKAGEKVAEKTRIVDTKQFFWTGSQEDLQLFGAQCQPTTGRAVVVTEGECFKGDTCVLTKEGWIRLDEWSGQDVLQVTEEGSSFVQPLAYVNKPYDGSMYTIGRGRYHVCTTPNHNLVIKDDEGHLKKLKTKDLTYQRNAPVFTSFNGEGIGYSDNLLRILVAVSADGTIDIRSDGNKYVRISFLKERKIERMRSLLRAEKIPYHEGVHQSGHTCFCFRCSEAFKAFPMSWISSLDSRQRLLVLDELQYWDGYRPKTRNQIEYYTTSYNNAVFVQTLAATSGIYGGICEKHYKNHMWSKGYTVRVCFDHKHSTIAAKYKTEEHYTGRVYCLQVPSGMLLIRCGKHISVCGNCDCLSMWQVLGGRSTCVSIPNGCKSFKAIKDNYEYLDKFDSIVLCLDGDRAGREATEKMVQYLPQKKVKIMKLPEDMKDPNEFLKAGKTQELVNLFWRAEPYTPKDIVNISQMYDRVRDYRKSHQYIPTPWQGLNDMLQGTRPGQVIVLASGSGQGKSLYLKTWMMHLVNTTDAHIGTLYLEETPEETVISLMSQVAGKNLKKNYIYDACTPEELKEYFDKVGAGARIDLFDPIGDTSSEYICNKIRYMAVVRDCKYIVVDHLTYISEAEDDVRRSLDKLMNSLHKIAVELGLVILCACHLRKSANSQKSAEEGSRITLADLKDSSSIYQLADVCLALERNSQDPDPDKANTTVIRVLKNRDFGEKGPATAVFYEKETTRLIELGLESLTDTIGDLE